jgi:hypothetical protein
MDNGCTITIDPVLKQTLDRWAKEAGVTTDQMVNEMLRRAISLHDFRRLQELIEPYARQLGITEDDILRDVS